MKKKCNLYLDYAFALCIMLIFKLIYEMQLKNITSALTAPGTKMHQQFISVKQLLDSVVFLKEPWR